MAPAEVGLPDPRHQQWVNSYAEEEFMVLVGKLLALADQWTFWDAVHRWERWSL